NSFNCVRGSAYHALAEIFRKNKEFALANLDIIQAAINEEHPAVQITSTALLLPILIAFSLLLHSKWQSRRYHLVLLISLLCALPLMLIWPLALHQTAANIFNLWWQYHAPAPFGGFRHFEAHFSLGYYLKNLIWFAFPAWPLAIWTATRCKLNNLRWGILGIIWLSLSLLVFALLPQQYQDLLVFLLPPLAVL
ncbi:Adaptin, partial [Snodgrassella alvi SCGC AB-598-P14]